MTNKKDHADCETSWVFSLFRPVLRDLRLQSLNPQICIRMSQKKYGFYKYNMARCVIVAMKWHFTNLNDKGVFVWTFNEEKNFYILYLIINDSLYADGMSHEERVRRKIVTTHEFTHCTAAMLSLSRIKSKQLIVSLQNSMRKSVDVIQSVDVDGIMSEFSKEMSTDLQNDRTELASRKFDDGHFRTNYESFTGSYYDLYTNFLLSKQLFEEYFTDEHRQEFNENMKCKNMAKAVLLLKNAAEKVIEEKNLDKKFVMDKIANVFIPLYLKEAAEFINAKK